jgi:choline dehydrogenase
MAFGSFRGSGPSWAQTILENRASLIEIGAHDQRNNNADGIPGNRIRGVYDYIIVGAGAAGSMLAHKLCQAGVHSVLILEAGRNNEESPTFTLSVNVSTFSMVANNAQGNKFGNNIGLPADPSISGEYGECINGKGWGGGGATNFVQATRPSDEWFERIAAITSSDWNAANALPLLKDIETFSNGASARHGDSGPIKVYETAAGFTTGDFRQNLANGMVSNPPPGDAGLALVSDHNDGTTSLICRANQQLAEKTGPTDWKRSYGGNEILQKIFDANGDGQGVNGRRLKLLSNSKVKRVMLNGMKRATGVEFVYKGTICLRVRARNKVILCAGAIETPCILEKSGIGDPAVLGEYGVPSLVNLPEVGNNLQNHPQISTYGEIPTNEAFGWFNNDAFFGPIGFLKLLPGNTKREVQIACGSFGPGAFNGRDASLNFLIPIPTLGAGPTAPLGVAGFLLGVEGRGSVHISGNNNEFAPNIRHTTFKFTGPNGTPLPSDHDYQVIVAYLKFAKASVEAAGYTMLWPRQEDYDAGDDRLVQIIRNNSGQTSHWSGTCKMSEVDGVVDNRLHVRGGVKDLMIADNSVWPIIPDGNTCIPAYYLGLRAYQILKAEFPSLP